MNQHLIQLARQKNLIDIVIKQGYPYTKSTNCIMIICPFHDESNASLAIYEDGFHCFACSEHGSPIDWIMRLYDVEFVDAVKVLLKKYA